MEAIHVVDHHGRSGDPLSVELAPRGLGPAGLRKRQVQAPRSALLPEIGRHDVAQWIEEIVHDHLRHAGGAGGEVQQHRVAFGVDGGAHVAGRRRGQTGIEVEPARLVTLAREGAQGEIGRGGGGLDGLPDGGLVDRQDQLHARRPDAVDQILGGEHVGGGNGDRADLVQTDDREPVGGAPLEDQHDGIALADPLRLEPGRRLVAQPRDVGHRVDGLGPGIVAPDQRAPVGILGRDRVDDIRAEVEVRGDLDAVMGGEFLVGVEGLPGQQAIQ